nr:MAG TPA: hypothetical protein [Caudoviricetes sp.]
MSTIILNFSPKILFFLPTFVIICANYHSLCSLILYFCSAIH